MSDFQEELRYDDGFEDVVIIAVGQSNISNFNTNFCLNSDLPLVMDQYPELPIRAQFNGLHKQVVIIDNQYNEIGRITLNSGLNASSKNYIRNIISEHYPDQILLGDINQDGIINVLDVIQVVNLILSVEYNDIADINLDGNVDVLDIVSIVNIILNP